MATSGGHARRRLRTAGWIERRRRSRLAARVRLYAAAELKRQRSASVVDLRSVRRGESLFEAIAERVESPGGPIDPAALVTLESLVAGRPRRLDVSVGGLSRDARLVALLLALDRPAEAGTRATR
jgi:hypothetical protein